jgi:hypothetical protein
MDNVSNLLTLSESIDRFPALKAALGQSWITEQEATDPVESAFILARWLRLPGFEQDLSTFNSILEQLSEVPGIAPRRRSLRRDPASFRETMVELYFASWLMSVGYDFSLPSSGPDLT